MNTETVKALLLMAAGNDPKRAGEIADYLGVEDQQKPAENPLFAPVGSNTIEDGIYLVYGTGRSFKKYTPGTVTELDKEQVTGIGVKLGSKSLVVDLFDLEGGEELTLTTAKSPADYDKAAYLDTCEDAGADWNGKANTARLQAAGLLNPRIADELNDGQYVPAMGEMLFVHLFRKEINQALREAGGDEIPATWYWTSTEYSASYAWRLGLSSGYMYGYTKASYKHRVRAVSAFIS